MSYFAKVLDGMVINVISAEASFFDTFVDTSPGEWLQTSYNTRGNVHYAPNSNTPDGGVALRGNFAGIGMSYDKENDVFIPIKPYPSWNLNKSTWLWDAPVPMPKDEKIYIWDESTVSWAPITPPAA